MMTLPADECQTCKRWVAHYCHEATDGPVTHTEPPTARECPLRLAVDESKTPNVRANRPDTAAQE